MSWRIPRVNTVANTTDKILTDSFEGRDGVLRWIEHRWSFNHADFDNVENVGGYVSGGLKRSSACSFEASTVDDDRRRIDELIPVGGVFECEL